ncbi:MAG: hypothetical protein ACOCV2_11080, partial [Persicimonas sp.]
MDRETQMQELLSRLAADPYDLVFVKELERLFADQIDTLVEAFDERAEETDDPEFAARLLVEAGRLAAIEQQDLRGGLELISRALERGEDTYVSVEAHLFDLALNEETEELLGFFTDALEHFDEPGYQSRLYQRMGAIMLHLLGDIDEAERAFEFALELVPDNVAALRSRQEVARAQGDWVGVAELLSEEVEYLDDPSMQARTALALGEVYEEHFDDEEQAEECFAIALQLDPDGGEVRERLAERGYVFDDEALEEEADFDELDVDGEELEAADDQAGDGDEEFDSLEEASAPADGFGAEPAPDSEAAAEDDPGTMELDDEMLVEEEPLEQDDPGTMELDDEMLVEEEPIEESGPPALQDQPPGVPGEESFDESEIDEVSEVSEVSEADEVSEVSEVDDDSEVDEVDEVS